jgi:hypothetical protein
MLHCCHTRTNSRKRRCVVVSPQEPTTTQEASHFEDMLYLQFGGGERKGCYTPWYNNNESYNNDFPLENEGNPVM